MDRRAETAGALLRSKKSGITGVIGAAPDDSVESALRLMAEKDIGALVVLEGSKLVGLVSERDYARKVELQGATARTKLVRDIMTRDLIPAKPADSVETCRRLMNDHQIRHLPVCEGDKVVGVLSIRDVLDQIILHDERHIKVIEEERMQMTTNTGSY
ncbi:CBS domain-containing protein [Methylobacterium sp. WSM2598]|uniref:CBS domain-containing protein n=1 Tax=Methylobacterium sp. WSM2598 TaxID=398261 RepID=UPI000373EE47|nr:CBS domain-containing protein [Methylobacterium sp. WSM2598]